MSESYDDLFEPGELEAMVRMIPDEEKEIAELVRMIQESEESDARDAAAIIDSFEDDEQEIADSGDDCGILYGDGSMKPPSEGVMDDS